MESEVTPEVVHKNVRQFDIPVLGYQSFEMQLYPDGGEHFFGVDEHGRHVVRYDTFIRSFNKDPNDRPVPESAQQTLPFEEVCDRLARPEVVNDKDVSAARSSYVEHTIAQRRGIGIGRGMSRLAIAKMKYDHTREEAGHHATLGSELVDAVQELRHLATVTLAKQIVGDALRGTQGLRNWWSTKEYRASVFSRQAIELARNAQSRLEAPQQLTEPRQLTDLYRAQTDTIIHQNRKKLLGAAALGAASLMVGYKGAKRLFTRG